jgi:hypothetical protein
MGVLLKENCKCCKRPLKDITSKLKGIGPICNERPRCSKCNKVVIKQPGGAWLIWLNCSNLNPALKHTENGKYCNYTSYCCSTEIVNVELIYDDNGYIGPYGETVAVSTEHYREY